MADRTIDLSLDGMLVPLRTPIRPDAAVLVSFALPGLTFAAEANVTRIVYGRRPNDEGHAMGLRFAGLSVDARTALSRLLQGRRPPLPRRGPLARLRRGEAAPELADAGAMSVPLADLADVEEDRSVDGLGVLCAVIDAWHELAPHPRG